MLADKASEWAGIPMPLDGERLIVEPSYPLAEILNRKPAEEDAEGWKWRNSWHSRRWRCTIVALERPDGKVVHSKLPAFHHISYDLRTMGCSDVWGIEQEHNALKLLGEMLRHRQFKQYLLTGMFLETSKRSGVTYIFRKLKPTVAIRPSSEREEMHILAALCMHPIAYYAESWAGAMCPTDDVIAHLSMMRGDEHMYWRRANQHAPYLPEAGL
ncbi:hypothetical protein [Sphingopyxis flava]|uniref:Uncharacterized protein n=1 Tax=Sphingopyxis flava TaxID=1507287 RepID=A0A1T5AD25_9SPHN|nr:hypothetical protein [Sphingopyxis flava]SKB32830.1 hypothetical protein SAMN06295937_1003115 [Sphingopyxis flava]